MTNGSARTTFGVPTSCCHAWVRCCCSAYPFQMPYAKVTISRAPVARQATEAALSRWPRLWTEAGGNVRPIAITPKKRAGGGYHPAKWWLQDEVEGDSFANSAFGPTPA